jgi:hypothetical protein
MLVIYLVSTLKGSRLSTVIISKIVGFMDDMIALEVEYKLENALHNLIDW